RSIWATEAASELSIVTCLLGLLGSAFLFIYGILFKNKIILSRHCIVMLGNSAIICDMQDALRSSSCRPAIFYRVSHPDAIDEILIDSTS
ncbi:hypothetical protein LINPERPRIM_LOCUS28295, partial [Linum perenne]